MDTLVLDKLAVERAELNLHALFGKHLLAELNAKWMAEGVQKYVEGVPYVQVLPEHRVGWRTAARTLAEVNATLRTAVSNG